MALLAGTAPLTVHVEEAPRRTLVLPLVRPLARLEATLPTKPVVGLGVPVLSGVGVTLTSGVPVVRAVTLRRAPVLAVDAAARHRGVLRLLFLSTLKHSCSAAGAQQRHARNG